MTSPIAVIGNVNADLVMGPQTPWPTPGTEVLLAEGGMRVGGSAGNAALALAALGHPFRIVANRGDDVLGRWLAEPFGAHAAAWTLSAMATTVSVGITHPDGERTFFTAPGHLADFSLEDVRAQLPARAEPGEIALLLGAFVCPALLDGYAALMDDLANRQFCIALDTGWPTDDWTEATRATVLGWLGRTQHLLLNEAETLALSGLASPHEAAAILRERLHQGGAVVVKRGPLGALVATADGVHETPAPVIKVIDTIGAGDCFNAGYLSVIASGGSAASAIEAGVAVASTAISSRPRKYALAS